MLSGERELTLYSHLEQRVLPVYVPHRGWIEERIESAEIVKYCSRRFIEYVKSCMYHVVDLVQAVRVAAVTG